MTNKKIYFLIFIIFLINSLVAYSASISLIDDWGSEGNVGGNTTDKITFVEGEIYPRLDGFASSSRTDTVCYNWDSDLDWDNCYWNTAGCGGGGCTNISCNYDSILSTMPSNWKAGCNFGTDCRIGIDSSLPKRICGTCDGVDTSNKKKVTIKAKVFYNCTSGNKNKEFVYQDFYIADKKRNICSGEDYRSQGRYSSGINDWTIIKNQFCPYNERCDTDKNHANHDASNDPDVESTSESAGLLDPCSITDGFTSSRVCASNNQCYSGNCGGSGTFYRPDCDSDGADGFDLTTKIKQKTCGGAGHLSGTSTDYFPKCSDTLGSNYVCDNDLDDTDYDSSSYSQWCKLKENATCTSDSQCWNDDGGYDCMGSAGNKICTTGETGKKCTNNDDAQCDSSPDELRCDQVSETCKSKLSDGLSCTDNSDCITGTCTAGKCGGAPAPKCSGTLNIFSEDSSGNAVASTYIYNNSQSQGQSDSNGYKKLQMNNVNCGQQQDIQVKCSDASTVCETKQAYIDIEGETESLTFSCQICLSKKDIAVSTEDVSIAEISSNTINASAIIRTQNLAPSNLEINFIGWNKNNGKEDSKQVTTSMSSYSLKLVSTTLAGNIHRISVIVDPSSKSGDENRNNNQADKYKGKVTKVYLDINTRLTKVNSVVSEYLKSSEGLKDVEFVSSSGSADITLKIGKPKPSDPINSFTASRFNIEVDKNDRALVYKGKKGIYPYNGVVASFRYSGVNYVLVYGTEIDGTIAAVKRLIERQSNYIKPGVEDSEYLNNLNIDAIAISDIMHANESNQQYYNQNSDNFKLIVNDTLFNNYQVDLKHVKANDGTVLRLKKVETPYSNPYNTARGLNKPVVYSGGLWNNLFKFKDFADEMAETGREGWMIEITGGPNEECDTCPDYTYNSLVDDWWPGSVAAALAYSESDGVLKANPSLDKADYVGFSNGCRVALDSLKDHGSGYSNNWKIADSSGSLIVDASLPASPIDTFVGVACPGAFVGDSVVEVALLLAGERAVRNIKNQNIKHITLTQLFKAGLSERLISTSVLSDQETDSPSNKISTNLIDQYVDWVTETSDPQPGSGVNVNKVLILEGRFLGKFNPYKKGDSVVTPEDQIAIYNNINANSKRRIAINRNHVGLPNDLWAQHFIRKTLNNESLTLFEKIAFLVEED